LSPQEKIAELEREIVSLSEQIEDEATPSGKPDGVFLSEMTEEEYEDYDRRENKGWKGFYKKVFNLNA
jgi:hypothetical protein